mmetsp:Transcript_1163/g.1594  ORF Transcript_1163/g.1594 Transcript_1163/m.1594 type:complete len:210 (-) Transcript_1163:71-700(-)
MNIPSKRDCNISEYTTITNHKYATVFRGLSTTFASSTQIDTNNLHEFLERTVSQISTSDNHIQTLFQQLHQPMDISTEVETLNKSFVEVVSFLIPIVHNFLVSQRQTQLHNSQPSPQNNPQPQYVFKVPTKETVFDKHWKEHFKELEKFKSLFGHCNVSRTTKGYDQLGNWLSDQRRKLRKGKLTRQQYDMLTTLGVEWERTPFSPKYS